MNTLIIYDTSGYIISQMGGDVREPVGIPFMWIEIPERKQIVGVDTSSDIHTPIYEDIPKTETELLTEQVNSLTLAMAEMLGV